MYCNFYFVRIYVYATFALFILLYFCRYFVNKIILNNFNSFVIEILFFVHSTVKNWSVEFRGNILYLLLLCLCRPSWIHIALSQFTRLVRQQEHSYWTICHSSFVIAQPILQFSNSICKIVIGISKLNKDILVIFC